MIAINRCCHVTESYRLLYPGRREDGLGFLLAQRGDTVWPVAVSDPGSTPAETAMKCLKAGLNIETTAKLVPPNRTIEDLTSRLMKKETAHGRTGV